MKLDGLFFFCEKPITRISYLRHNVAVPGALAGRFNATQFSFVREGTFQFECPWTLRSVKQIQQHDSAPTQNQHFHFYNEVITYLPPINWHWDKTVAAFANIHAGMLNHVWGNLGHNTFVTCAITTFSIVKTQNNLKCKRNWKFALICATYKHRFVHLGVSTVF